MDVTKVNAYGNLHVLDGAHVLSSEAPAEANSEPRLLAYPVLVVEHY